MDASLVSNLIAGLSAFAALGSAVAALKALQLAKQERLLREAQEKPHIAVKSCNFAGEDAAPDNTIHTVFLNAGVRPASNLVVQFSVMTPEGAIIPDASFERDMANDVALQLSHSLVAQLPSYGAFWVFIGFKYQDAISLKQYVQQFYYEIDGKNIVRQLAHADSEKKKAMKPILRKHYPAFF